VAAGLTLDDWWSDKPAVLCWPENRQVVELFMSLCTQWLIGINGPTGLNYAAITPLVLRAIPISRAEWPQAFHDLRVMEAAALAQMREERDE
jgi:hypothetical protein